MSYQPLGMRNIRTTIIFILRLELLVVERYGKCERKRQNRKKYDRSLLNFRQKKAYILCSNTNVYIYIYLFYVLYSLK